MGAGSSKTPEYVLESIHEFETKLDNDLKNKPEQFYQLDISRKMDFEKYMKHKSQVFDEDCLETFPKELSTHSHIIRYLKVNFHRLSELPSEIKNFKTLKSIQLRANQISNISHEISSVQSLTYLDLHDNCLETLPVALLKLRHLQKLDLSNNRLSALPELKENDSFLSLTKLNLNSNELTHLPEALGKLKNLKILLVKLNKCKSPPQKICDLGSDALIQFIKLPSDEQDGDEFHKKFRENEEKNVENEMEPLNLNNEEDEMRLTFASSKNDGEIIFEIPEQHVNCTTLSSDDLLDAVAGVIFGNAVGDAIGLLTEFMGSDESHFHCFLPLNYSDTICDRHRCKWIPGDWTDDTDQMLVIMNSIIEMNGEIKIIDIAQKLSHWSNHGFEEFGDICGLGIGNTVGSVLSHSKFLEEPHVAAEYVYNARGKRGHSNGAVMRTSILGIHQFYDEEKVEQNTIDVCKITHASHKCAASCVAVTTYISEVLRGTDPNDPHLIEKCFVKGSKYLSDEEQEEFRKYIFVKNISDLKLDAPNSIGYTFKTAGSGFWAVSSGLSFEEAITQIVLMGGDADTNAAVAGAMLGAKFTFKHLPKRWVEELIFFKNLRNKIEEFLGVMFA